jgi:hypothetical protein
MDAEAIAEEGDIGLMLDKTAVTWLQNNWLSAELGRQS